MDTTFILQVFLKTDLLGQNYFLKAFKLNASNTIWTILDENKVALLQNHRQM